MIAASSFNYYGHPDVSTLNSRINININMNCKLLINFITNYSNT